MPNMSYCRFENTYKDLVDCMENIVYVADGFDENYRQLMIDLFATVAEQYGGDIVGYAQNETFD
jgi:hypothetical protein